MCSYNGYLSYLAAAYLYAGRPTEAAETIEEGIALCRTLLARFHEPELHRLKGKVLRKQGDLVGAESCYRSAIAMAEHDGSLAYALRAATELARFLIAVQRPAEALDVLGRIYGRFTEGFATHDLLQANSLLRDLRETPSGQGQVSRIPTN
jgi:tetratricopeptide (TPR) repeat protein